MNAQREYLLAWSICFVLPIAFLSLGSAAHATDMSEHHEPTSSHFTESTGIELSEKAIEAALQDPGLWMAHSDSICEVIAEQQYLGVLWILKILYEAESPYLPEVGTREFQNTALYGQKVYIARTLVRCGDPDGVRMVLECVLDADWQKYGAHVRHAINNLRYLVKHTDEDLSDELELLMRRSDDSVLLCKYAYKEALIIEHYLNERGEQERARGYSQARERVLQDTTDTQLRSIFEIQTVPRSYHIGDYDPELLARYRKD